MGTANVNAQAYTGRSQEPGAGVHVKCHVGQVKAMLRKVQDRLGQDRLEACAWARTLAE